MRILNQTELQALLAAIPERSPFGARDRALFILMLNTGLRVGEVAGLDVADVAEGGRPRSVLTLRGAIAKGGRGRLIELNSVARDQVAKILTFNAMRGFPVTPESPLLMTRQHTRLPVRTIQHYLQNYREKAQLGVSPTPHTLRHMAATQLARCANLRVVQQTLGHRKLETCSIYVTPSREERAEAMERLAQSWGA